MHRGIESRRMTFGPSSAPQTASVQFSVLVRSPQTVAISRAADAAGAAGSDQLAATLSDLVRKDFPKLRSESCPGTFPDESAQFITALGRTITVRGTCEPAFTNLWDSLSHL